MERNWISANFWRNKKQEIYPQNSVAVYLIAVLEVVGIFLAMMGYLMLEGDPVLFGETVYKINIWAVTISVVLAFVLFLSVSFRVREGAEK